MILVKSILGGVGATILAFTIVSVVYSWQFNKMVRSQGTTGLYATAGSWNLLLQRPLVILLLAIAFGLGLYLTARITAR